MKKGVFCVSIVSSLLAFFMPNETSWATDFVVYNSIDLQDVLITAQSNGQADTILIKTGTYPVTTTLTYQPSENYALTIVGEGSGTTILDGGGSVPILKIDTTGLVDDSKADITIRRLTFQNGLSSLEESGGGLFAFTNSAGIMVRDSVFYNNSAGGTCGGASTITDTGKITFANNTFDNNYAGGGGGACISSNSGIVTVESNTFTNNLGWFAAAGAIIGTDSGIATLKENTFTDNHGRYLGGGAAIFTDSGILTIENNTFTDNVSVDGAGGGVAAWSYSGTIFLNNNYIISNSADFGSGLSTITDIGTIISTNNIFNGNFGGYGGGGAAARAGLDNERGGTIAFTNNTIVGNKARGAGGGLMAYLIGNNTQLDIYNNIIWGNTFDDYGGANDIYINDDWDPSSAPDNIGAIVNLSTNDYSSFYINLGDHLFLGANIDQDPLLSSDYHLQKGSPCIDAGNNDAPYLPHKDFEGNQRVINRIVDIGADEFRKTR